MLANTKQPQVTKHFSLETFCLEFKSGSMISGNRNMWWGQLSCQPLGRGFPGISIGHYQDKERESESFANCLPI